MSPMLNIAIRAARAAGDVIIRQIDYVQDLPIIEKGRNDFVTKVDKHAEIAIIDILRKAYPDHAFLAEESGQQGNSPYLWIIDPLDGTTNYLHGFPQYAVSIALQYRDKLVQAVVYDPLRQELFTASGGEGAMLNNKRIRVSKQKNLGGALLGTGFPFKQQQRLDEYLSSFKVLFPMTSGIRRAGAAALDLAYIACGRLDGFWELGLKPWDMAAGVLLIQEAGGFVSDLYGEDTYLQNGDIIAANPKIHHEILNIINNQRTSSLHS